MPIKHKQAPVGAIDALQDGLQHAIRNNAHVVRSCAAPSEKSSIHLGVPKFEAAAPRPVFTVDLQDIAKGKLLEAAKPIGWRFLILQGNNALIAGTVVESGGKMALNSINEGRLVGLTLDSLSAAEVAEEIKDRDFELRYLEVRPLYFVGVWLHSDNDNYIIPLEDSRADDITAHSLQTETKILKMLQSQQAFGSAFPEPLS